MNQLSLFGSPAPPLPPDLSCPPEHVGSSRGRVGRVYTVRGERLKLLRIDPDAHEQHEFVLQKVNSPGAFKFMSLRQWLKATQCRHTGILRPGDTYFVPCTSCRLPAQQPGSIHCSACIEELRKWRSSQRRHVESTKGP